MTAETIQEIFKVKPGITVSEAAPFIQYPPKNIIAIIENQLSKEEIPEKNFKKKSAKANALRNLLKVIENELRLVNNT